ncbi:DNA alkylation repair protein [Mycetocola miduiensis]|uniref:3-methyladenine DNA glycosylase AlkD n=1 Tax=Mycetocola miduiensis TaxID=995034 RepID=A0A1I5AZS0_9MICO|nr:DNA alkylation repair protein [Mycetocola miduiensis]SFN67953.1 3-methyladenine DNA glycosylase AlkD [Mycetocola miduiensis]
MTDAIATDVKDALAAVASAERAAGSARFFKTGPGEYGEGDVFLGVTVPDTRRVVKRFVDLPLAEIDALLDSPVHEHRLAALLILVAQFERASASRTRNESVRRELAAFYLAAVRHGSVNNWDLVDSSAPTLLGGYLLDRPRDVLFELASSEVLWQRRVAVLATFGFINASDASTTLELAERLLDDRADLMQKAVGWMLREVGKRVGREVLTGFLDMHAASLGRTALSYATEHLPAEERARYRAMR